MRRNFRSPAQELGGAPRRGHEMLAPMRSERRRVVAFSELLHLHVSISSLQQQSAQRRLASRSGGAGGMLAAMRFERRRVAAKSESRGPHGSRLGVQKRSAWRAPHSLRPAEPRQGVPLVSGCRRQESGPASSTACSGSCLRFSPGALSRTRFRNRPRRCISDSSAAFHKAAPRDFRQRPSSLLRLSRAASDEARAPRLPTAPRSSGTPRQPKKCFRPSGEEAMSLGARTRVLRRACGFLIASAQALRAHHARRHTVLHRLAIALGRAACRQRSTFRQKSDGQLFELRRLCSSFNRGRARTDVLRAPPLENRTREPGINLGLDPFVQDFLKLLA